MLRSLFNIMQNKKKRLSNTILRVQISALVHVETQTAAAKKLKYISLHWCLISDADWLLYKVREINANHRVCACCDANKQQ